MMKDYQKTTALVGTDAELVLPEAVNVAMAEIGGAVKEGLLALAVATGLQVMTTMMEESVAALAGPKGRHQPDRSAVRHGTEAGSVVLGGRWVPVRRPRVRASDGSGELPVDAYETFSGSDLLGEIALERMMAKLSTRRYRAGLEPVGGAVEASARSTSKSSVSRRFVARTETALAELMDADLAPLDVVAVMIDGVHFAGHCCVVALGIGIDGTKTPLGVVEGDTENATVVKDLLAGLRDRGLDVTRPMLVVIDGAKALTAAVHAVFDHPSPGSSCLH
jgi:transposase-like protein